MTARETCWLVGGRGMLGGVLARQLTALDCNVAITDHELDIGDQARVLAFADRERPAAIINAAAYTRVDDAETHEAEAFRANADGPAHLAEAAKRVGARLIHVSTDYVFDGRGNTPYREEHRTAPCNAYGRSKLAGEQRALAILPQGAYVLRSSWLFGEGGPNFVKTMFTLMHEKPELRVVDDQWGRPTYTHDLAAAAIRLAGLADARSGAHAPPAPGVYHFANAEPTTWYRFTLAIRDACEACGATLAVRTIQPVTSAEFPRPAARPAYSVLDTAKIERECGLIPRNHLSALREYVEHLCLERARTPEE